MKTVSNGHITVVAKPWYKRLLCRRRYLFFVNQFCFDLWGTRELWICKRCGKTTLRDHAKEKKA